MRDGEALEIIKPVVVLFRARQSHTNYQIRPSATPHGFQGLARKAQPVFKTAAVFIVSDIYARIEELGDQIPVRSNYLDPVQASLTNTPRRRLESCYNIMDKRAGHFLGKDMKPLVGDGRRRDSQSTRAVGRKGHFTPRMRKLGKHLATKRLASLGNALIPGDAGIIIGPYRRTPAIARNMGSRSFQNNQPRATFGPRLMVSDHCVTRDTTFQHNGHVTRRKDTVLQACRADIKR